MTGPLGEPRGRSELEAENGRLRQVLNEIILRLSWLCSLPVPCIDQGIEYKCHVCFVAEKAKQALEENNKWNAY